MASLNKFEIESFAKRAAQDFLSSGRNLNESVAEMAGSGDWNREQIKRVVEATNTIVNGALVKKAKAEKSDARITFAMADSVKIGAILIADMPEAKIAAQKNVDRLSSMFIVPLQDTKAAAELLKTAHNQSSFQPVRRVSPEPGVYLGQRYLQGDDVSAWDWTLGQVADAVEALSEVSKMASQSWAALDNDEQAVLAGLAREAETQMHAGMTPATIKHVIDSDMVAALPEHRKIAAEVIDAVAQELGRDQGRNQIDPGSIIDGQHPLIAHVHGLVDIDVKRASMLSVDARVQDAESRAKTDLSRMSREGVDKTASLSTAITKIKDKVAPLGSAVNLGLGAVDVRARAMAATQRLKKMQATPAVAAMKMADLRQDLGTLGKAMLIAGAASAVVGGADRVVNLVGKNVGDMFERRKRQQLFDRIVAKEPSLKNNPNARTYFDLILTYAPALSAHDQAVADFLKRQMQYPVSSVEFLQSLANLQKTVTETQAKAAPGPSSFAAGALGAVGKVKF